MKKKKKKKKGQWIFFFYHNRGFVNTLDYKNLNLVRFVIVYLAIMHFAMWRIFVCGFFNYQINNNQINNKLFPFSIIGIIRWRYGHHRKKWQNPKKKKYIYIYIYIALILKGKCLKNFKNMNQYKLYSWNKKRKLFTTHVLSHKKNFTNNIYTWEVQY